MATKSQAPDAIFSRLAHPVRIALNTYDKDGKVRRQHSITVVPDRTPIGHEPGEIAPDDWLEVRKRDQIQAYLDRGDWMEVTAAKATSAA